MSNTTTGLKAGIVAGIVYGVLDGIFAVVIFNIFKTDVMNYFSKIAASLPGGINITAQSLYNSAVLLAPILSIVGGLIVGLILGAIFGWGQHKLPGKTPMIKGIVFGAIIWAILNAGLGLADIGTYGLNYYLVNIGLGIIAALIFGFLLGILFNKWKEAPMEEPEWPTAS